MRAGEKNGRAKSTWQVVEEMRAYYNAHKQPRPNQIRNSKDPTGYVSTYTVAAMLGISQGAAWAMLNYKTWRKNGTDAAGAGQRFHTMMGKGKP